MPSRAVHEKRVYIERGQPVFRDTVYAGGRITGTLYLRARTESYVHITGSTIPVEKPSKDTIERFREETEGKQDPSEILDTASKYVEAYRGIRLKHIRFKDTPVIPGSSLKGAVRARLELLLLEHNGVNIACFIRSSRAPRRTPPIGRHGWRHVLLWLNTVSEERGRACDATSWNFYEDISVCRLCDLFGTSGLSSRVYFGTMYPSGNNVVEELTVLFSRRRGIKGVVEAVRPNAEFSGEILVNGLDLGELGLLAVGLRLHEDRPILIGRFKYRRVRIIRDGGIKARPFGRLNIWATELRAPMFIEETLNRYGVSYEVDKGSIVVRGSGLSELISKAVNEAYRIYGSHIPRSFDEIEELEKIWREYEGGSRYGGSG